MSQQPPVEFERMRPGQIRTCRELADIAFLPLGALEWHGLQAPVGTDGLKSHDICCRAARRLGGGAVFPPVYHGLPGDSFFMGITDPPDGEKIAAVYGTETERFFGFGRHGGMDVQEQWLAYQRLLRMSLETIARFGFRSIYICSGHNPLVHWAKPVAVAFARASSMAGQAVTVDVGGEFDAAGLDGDHGGKWETSLMQAMVPETVDLAELDRHPELCGRAHGADAVDATAEQGEAWAEACAEAIAAEARWLVENYPQLPKRHGHWR